MPFAHQTYGYIDWPPEVLNRTMRDPGAADQTYDPENPDGVTPDMMTQWQAHSRASAKACGDMFKELAKHDAP